jgi:hypothetical protein
MKGISHQQEEVDKQRDVPSMGVAVRVLSGQCAKSKCGGDTI